MEHRTLKWTAADSAHKYHLNRLSAGRGLSDTLARNEDDVAATLRMRDEGGIGESAQHWGAEEDQRLASAHLVPRYAGIPVPIVDPAFQRETDHRDDAKRIKALSTEVWDTRYCALGDG